MFSKSDEINEGRLGDIVQQIVDYSDDGGRPMILKYDKSYIIDMLEGEKMKLLETKFGEFDKKGVDIIDFVKIFLNVLEHSEHETLYLIVGLIDIFKEISEHRNMATHVKLADFTSYIVDVSKISHNAFN